MTWLRVDDAARRDATVVSRNQVGKLSRRGAEDGLVLAGVFDEQRHADGGDEHGELRAAAQRTVGEQFDHDADQRADRPWPAPAPARPPTWTARAETDSTSGAR